jgi:hypothetical protein
MYVWFYACMIDVLVSVNVILLLHSYVRVDLRGKLLYDDYDVVVRPS